MSTDTTPVLIGAGQFTQRDVEPAQAKEPVEMMVEVARRAAADAGGDPRLLARADTVAVVNVIGWQYVNPPAALADRLGIRPARQLYTTVGGNTPQFLVNEIAEQIAAGQVRLALVAGAEAIRTLLRARRTGTVLSWHTNGGGAPTVVGDARPGTTTHELNNGLQMPTQIYPLFENALRAHSGLDLQTHRQRLGELCSRMSVVAAQNPYAWFPRARTAVDIATVGPDNRLIGFPYPKYMNAIIEVDQAAAVIMASTATARALGVDPSRWVYLWGCGDAHDLWYVSERVDYVSSPAIRAAAEQATTMAGVGIEAIDYFDLYSCFPCAVQIARDMLGVAADDPRPLTVTGGLPYHGGPGNNYSMHAIATMMDRLRARPGTVGLVSALGWYLTKHSLGIYGTQPVGRPWRRPDQRAWQQAIDDAARPELCETPAGRARVETYTVLHDRDGRPNKGLIIGRLADGRRFLANVPHERALLEELTNTEGVGRSGRASAGDGANCFVPD